MTLQHTCELCNKGFDTLHGLRTHKARMHKVASTERTKKKPGRKPGAKRKQTYNNPPAITSKPNGVAVHFCPGCGCNIQLVQVALETAREAFNAQS